MHKFLKFDLHMGSGVYALCYCMCMLDMLKSVLHVCIHYVLHTQACDLYLHASLSTCAIIDAFCIHAYIEMSIHAHKNTHSR